MLSLEPLIITEEIIVFDDVKILCETLVKLIRDDYELKTSQRRHELRDIVSNHFWKLILNDTQNERTIISERINKGQD